MGATFFIATGVHGQHTAGHHRSGHDHPWMSKGPVVLSRLPATGDEPPSGRNREIPGDPLGFISVKDPVHQFEKSKGQSAQTQTQLNSTKRTYLL
jgi:hypothetical protein